MNAVISTNPELVPIEDIDRDIRNLCCRINAATYELLVLIRQFDQRVGWAKWGLHSCAEWLAWRCDLSLATAREKVRVAHQLEKLPLVSEAFSTGELSYSKVRSLTRVANETNEDELLVFALRHTAVQVAERCHELRMGDASSAEIAERAFANRALRMHRNASKGTMTITVDLPMEAGELVDKALDKARDDERLQLADVVDVSWAKQQADAFVTMAREYLAGDAGNGRSDNHLVTVHVDQSALSGEGGRSSLPIETVKRLCCDSHAVVITEYEGEPLSIGRKTRVVPTAIERAVRARDHNCCVFPGCSNKRFLHCHHVEHWSNGGETSLENLMLLCSKHHTLVHEGGFRIEKDFSDSWYFVRPDGIAVPNSGYRSQDMIDADMGENLDPPRGGLLSISENYALEPPPPAYLH